MEENFRVVTFRWMMLLTETVLWALPPLIFLCVYIGFFEAPTSILVPHLKIIVAIWLGVGGLRLLNWRFVRPRGVQRIAAAVLLLLPPLLLVIWYVCVLIGLVSWGRVATWSMFKVYLLQGGYLFDVLGISSLTVFVICFLIVLFFGCSYCFIKVLDISRQASARLSLLSLLFISLLGITSASALTVYLPGQVYSHSQEPIGVSFFPGRASALQSHAVAVSPRIDAAENEAVLSYHPSQVFKSRNVVLIVGDALRSDHMGIYGYGRDTTPYLAASILRHQTLWARSTRSVCAESSCGLMALASSRPLHLLPSKPITLHSVLRQHGYKVNLMLSGDHTNFYGLKEAYGTVDEYFDGSQQKVRYVNDDFLLVDHVASLPRYDGQQSVMFQFHLMSTHGLGLRHKREDSLEPAVNYYSWPSGKGRKAPSLDEVPKAVNYYDNGVVQFDSVVDKILRELESKGYLDNAVVVITGDHGEMLGEKGLFGHQYRVDEEVLRIPFVLQRRGYDGNNFGDWRLASQVDIAPTILRELEIDSPPVWRGVPLQSQASSRVIHFQQAPQVGLYISDGSLSLLKYWRDLSTGEEYVFDIKKDPQETENISGTIDPRVIASWRVAAASSAVSGVSDFSDE
ncbi:sulfatase-like hydrolase/transferase [Pseudomonas sp. CrR14]|nr:sulfatase-like hydrolase/transferase [Pseudomonas sp. CrR14]